MTKNEIKTLAQDIARNIADSDSLDAYYDEAIEELGKLPDPVMVEHDLLSLTSGTATYSYPTAAVEILHAFHASYQLTQVTEETLEAYEITWRNDSGTPKAWKTENEDTRTIRIYPIPNVTSTALGIGATEPFGEDFPTNMAALVYSDSRESNISDMVGLYVAFRILYKEFIRPSDHQDVEWAILLKKAAEVFYHMGVMRHDQRKKGKEATAA